MPRYLTLRFYRNSTIPNRFRQFNVAQALYFPKNDWQENGMDQPTWNIQEQGIAFTANGGINIAFRHGHPAAQPLADLISADHDYFTCASEETADITSELTVVGGRSVFAAGDFASLAQAPPAMPDWSPVRGFGRDGSWGGAKAPQYFAVNQNKCGCSQSCALHGHKHAAAWSSDLPVSDVKTFWG
jgi:hypothetical protein